jgi:SSS family solute:Na+ symporter
VPDFNIWWVLIAVAGSAYNYMAWQGNQGFNASALNPHEARMGRILGQWRQYVRWMQMLLLGVCAYTFLNSVGFAESAAGAKDALGDIADPRAREQMYVPVALSHLLPIGIKGMFAAVMLFAMIACDTSYMHSWGSIFIQDVVMPFRRTHLPPRQHLRLLRWSIVGVAAFAFFFSLLFRQTEYILMYFAVTGAIYLGGAGSVIIGGLYWKRGTTSAAWTAMITGSTLAVAGLVAQQVDSDFPINGQYMYAMAMGAAVLVYITVSLLTCRQKFDMERLLHRGKYAIDADSVPGVESDQAGASRWRTLLGIDPGLTRGDLVQSVTLSSWTLLWFAVFIVITVWNLVQRWPVAWWAEYWYYVGTLLPIVVGLITTVWLTIGGLRDLRLLFVRLRTAERDAQDDGLVTAESGPGFPVIIGARATVEDGRAEIVAKEPR